MEFWDDEINEFELREKGKRPKLHLIHTNSIRTYIKNRHPDLDTTFDFYLELKYAVQELIDDAAERTRRNHRKRIAARDV